MRIKLEKYRVLTTGVDGGHHYLTTEIEYENRVRKLVIYFANKSDEKRLQNLNSIQIEGQLVDDGLPHSLTIHDAKLLN